MRLRIFAVILLTALAGLTFVQFRLLHVGIGLEKERFDENTEAALREVGRSLNMPSPLTGMLIQVLAEDSKDTILSQQTALGLDSLLSADLKKRGISTDFSFAITDKTDQNTFLVSDNFKRKDFKFNRYSLLLGSHIISGCNCEAKLHLDAPNLFGYLLGELVYLILPSFLCLLAILTGFVLLLNMLRKAEKLNIIKNDFINNLTHELKTPAFSISLSSRLARESVEKGDLEKAKQYLAVMGKENEKIKTHIEKVLELASLESGRYTLQKEETDAHELISAAMDEFKVQAEARLGYIKGDFKAKQWILFIDRDHFKNLVGNLLDNALKYTPGVPAILVKTSNENGKFILTVSDNGPGIDPVWRKQVFEKFFRAPAANGQVVKGFGLGLSYIKQIAEAHGGKVELESTVGNGTKVSVTLPLP